MQSRILLSLAAPIIIALFSPTVDAKSWPQPPQLLDAGIFDQLLTAVKSEPFTDGKLERLRAISGGKRYVFTAVQAVALLDAFSFWIDRLEALRIVPIVDRGNATAVARYFDPAPSTIRSEARRILAIGE